MRAEASWRRQESASRSGIKLPRITPVRLCAILPSGFCSMSVQGKFPCLKVPGFLACKMSAAYSKSCATRACLFPDIRVGCAQPSGGHVRRFYRLPDRACLGRTCALRARDPAYATPPGMGELSIQSLLIQLQLDPDTATPLVLFEDGWFLRNAAGLAKQCVLISTHAFLINAERCGLIASATQALAAIAAGNRVPYAGIVELDLGKALKYWNRPLARGGTARTGAVPGCAFSAI